MTTMTTTTTTTSTHASDSRKVLASHIISTLRSVLKRVGQDSLQRVAGWLTDIGYAARQLSALPGSMRKRFTQRRERFATSSHAHAAPEKWVDAEPDLPASHEVAPPILSEDLGPPPQPVAPPPHRVLQSVGGHHYHIATSRATGGFGPYRFAIDERNKPWAVREVRSSDVDEIQRLRRLSRRFVIHDEIQAISDDGTRDFVVLPLLAGDLGDAVARLKDPHLRRALARSMVAQIADDLVHIHELNHIHRDIRLANMLWDSDGLIVVGDYSSTMVRDEKGYCRGPCGATGYMAPEVLFQNAYNEKIDIWSLAMAFATVCDNRLQRLFALMPRNQDLVVSFATWREVTIKQADWTRRLKPSSSRWDDFFASLASFDREMCEFVLARMLEPRIAHRATAIDVQRYARKLHPRDGAADRELKTALCALADQDAKRSASLAALRCLQGLRNS